MKRRYKPKHNKNVTIPKVLNVEDYARNRLNHMITLANTVETNPSSGGGKRVFQQLPKHLRRRAMSNNPYRLPQSLRSKAKKKLIK